MRERVVFSGQHAGLDEIAEHHRDVEDGLRLLFSPVSPQYAARFFSYTPAEVSDELKKTLDEADKQSTMSLLSAIEAAFRIDYLRRSYDRGRDDVSRSFRDVHRRKKARAGLEDDILEVWKTCCPDAGALIGHLRSAFRYRHWLAHGRYWIPKFGRAYDFPTVFLLGQQAFHRFSL